MRAVRPTNDAEPSLVTHAHSLADALQFKAFEMIYGAPKSRAHLLAVGELTHTAVCVFQFVGMVCSTRDGCQPCNQFVLMREK
jgi:hypothetical protein